MGVGVLTRKEYLSYLGTYTRLFRGLNYTDFKPGKRSEAAYFLKIQQVFKTEG